MSVLFRFLSLLGVFVILIAIPSCCTSNHGPIGEQGMQGIPGPVGPPGEQGPMGLPYDFDSSENQEYMDWLMSHQANMSVAIGNINYLMIPYFLGSVNKDTEDWFSKLSYQLRIVKDLSGSALDVNVPQFMGIVHSDYLCAMFHYSNYSDMALSGILDDNSDVIDDSKNELEKADSYSRIVNWMLELYD